MSDYRVSDKPEWQPYRSPTTGEVVTVTPDQCAAIMHALGVWEAVTRPQQGALDRHVFLRDAVRNARRGLGVINMKSCLLGRLLYQGKAPLVDAPPLVHSAPDYSVEQS